MSTDNAEAGQILVTGEGAIRVVVLNAPEKLNSLDQAMHRDLESALVLLEDDAEVRAVVLTGAGDRAFSTGGRRGEFATSVDDRRRRMRGARRIFEAMVNLHVPVIAAVNGPAVGLGSTLVAASDIVIMAETAFLADTHVAVGLVAGDGGAATWPLHIGLLRAKEYLLTGDRMPAAKALEFGLATRVVPQADVMATAMEFAQRIAAMPGQAVQDTKQVLNQYLRSASTQVLQHGLAAEAISFFIGGADDVPPRA